MRNEENRKHYNYHALVKKLKKEIGDKTSPSLKYLRQMLPLPKLMTEVIVTEPFGYETNEKGNKVKGLNCDKKPGMQVSEKQKISPWDILEGKKKLQWWAIEMQRLLHKHYINGVDLSQDYIP